MEASEGARDATSPGALLPDKVAVDGRCPECGAAELAQYPVLSAGGWFEVVKCQRCLASISRAPWHALGWVRLGIER